MNEDLKSILPFVHNLHRKIKYSCMQLLGLEVIFTQIYKRRLWDTSGSGSVSGLGSTLNATVGIREKLPSLVQSLGVKTILDAPCGDFNWMSVVLPELEINSYIGVDIVEEIIKSNKKYSCDKVKFLKKDIILESLPEADLIVCRHCLIHLNFKDGIQIIKNFKSTGATYLLITTNPQIKENKEILSAGSFRPVNLEISPFNLPKNIGFINDSQDLSDETILALYKLQEIYF